MLDALGKLPKVIDAFVAGVIELAYIYVVAVARTLARPVAGPRLLLMDEDHMSSRTALFSSSTILAAIRFVGVERFNLVGGDGTGALLIRVVALYALFDLLAAAASRATLPECRTAARSAMRYSFAAALALAALSSVALQMAHVLSMSAVIALEGDLPTSTWCIVLAASTLLFYAPAVTRAGLAGIPASGWPAIRSAWLAGGAVAALGLACLTIVTLLSPVVQEVLGGRFETASETCELARSKVRVIAAFSNGRGEPLAISRNSLWLELALVAPGERTMRDALDGHAFRVNFDRIEGGMLVVMPGETRVMRAEANLLPEELAKVGDDRANVVCRLAARKLPPLLLSTSGRRLEHAIDDESVLLEPEMMADEAAEPDHGPGSLSARPPAFRPHRATAVPIR